MDSANGSPVIDVTVHGVRIQYAPAPPQNELQARFDEAVGRTLAQYTRAYQRKRFAALVSRAGMYYIDRYMPFIGMSTVPFMLWDWVVGIEPDALAMQFALEVVMRFLMVAIFVIVPFVLVTMLLGSYVIADRPRRIMTRFIEGCAKAEAALDPARINLAKQLITMDCEQHAAPWL